MYKGLHYGSISLSKGGDGMGIGEDMTELERMDTQKALLYDLRLQILESEKTTFTKDDVLLMLDNMALSKSTK